MTNNELDFAGARNSLWEALHNWEETADLFRLELRWNVAIDQIDNLGPSISDLPAISILPVSTLPFWFTHVMMQFPVLYSVKIWTQDWALPEAEDTVEKVMNAFYRATPAGSTVTYVKAATGFYPTRLGPITWTPAFAGKDEDVKTFLTEMSIGLLKQKDPFG